MRLLLTGDFHLDATTAGVPRLQDVCTAWDQVVQRVVKEGISLVLFLGDVCNPDKGTRTLRAVDAMVGMVCMLPGRRMVLLAGNHDTVQDDSGLTTLSPLVDPFDAVVDECEDESPDRKCPVGWKGLSGKNGVAVAESPQLVSIGGRPGFVDGVDRSEPPKLHVLCLPSVSPLRSYDPQQVVYKVATWREANGLAKVPLVVAGHLQLEGAQLGTESTDMARGRDVAFPVQACLDAKAALMCNGHYHKRQVVSGVQCPGSLVRLGFGEVGNEPVWLEVEV